MTESLPERFSKTRRLHDATEFQAVFQNGMRSSGAFFRVHFLAAQTPYPARLGLAVPKKAVPLSVTRNRIKRQCREMFRHRQDLLPGDYVFVAQRRAADADNAALRLEIERLLTAISGPGAS
jgi:ribonuclease P protein component